MNAEIWTDCVAQWSRTVELFRAKGAEASEPDILPPAPTEQIEEFEVATGLSLPLDFQNLFSITGGFKIDWSLAVSGSNDWLTSPVYFGNFGGHSDGYFIGATESLSLLQIYNLFQEELLDCYVGGDDEEESRAIHRLCFPLFPADISGDYLVMRLDRDPCEIHFLDHELGYTLYEVATQYDRSLVARGLTNFLIRWTALSYPAPNYLCGIIKYGSSDEIETETKESIQWKAWLEDTSARETKA